MPIPVRRLLNRLRGEGIGAVLARGASAFFAIHVVGLVVAFGVQVALARALGAEDFGVYVYATSWLMVLLLFCRVGLGTGAMRFVAAYAAREDWPRLRGFLRTSAAVVFVASLVVAGATAGVTGLLALDPPMARTFQVVSFALPVYALLQLWGFALRGLKRVLASQIPSTVLQPILLGLSVLAVLRLDPDRLDPPTAMLLNLGSALAALVVTAVWMRRSVPAQALAAEPRVDASAWLRTGAPLLLVNFLNVASRRMDVLMLGILAGSLETGLYAPAARVAGVIAFGLQAVNAWAAPLISDLHARGDRPGLQRLVRLAARGVFLFTLPLFLGVVFFGDRILALFGPEFVAAHRALVVLAGAQLVNALVGPVGYLMTMTGRQNTVAWVLAFAFVAGLALNAALIPVFGFEGAAVARASTWVAWNLVTAWLVWRRMGLRATIV